MSLVLRKGDCLELLKTIDDNSIDLILTDPPYELKNGGEGKSELSKRTTKLKTDIEFMSNSFDMDNVFTEFMRVCKEPNMLIFCSNRQIEKILHWFSDKGVTTTVLCWVKPNPIPSANGNHLSDIEYCIYVRGKGVTFNNDVPFDYKRKAYISPLVSPINRFHPAQKPGELLKRYIELHSNVGDTILDPFMGSDSTGVWCKKLDRNFIGFEITDKYFDIATQRIDGTTVKARLI